MSRAFFFLDLHYNTIFIGKQNIAKPTLLFFLSKIRFYQGEVTLYDDRLSVTMLSESIPNQYQHKQITV